MTVASERSWNVIIIDNLQACASEAIKGQATDLTDFIKELKDNGSTVIFINHAKKYGDKFKGDGALEDLSQNIIRVANFCDDSKCDPTDSLEQEDTERKSESKTFKLTVLKCKVDGNTIEDKSSFYKLPIGGTWEYVGGNLPHFDGSTPLPSSVADPLPLLDGEESTANATQEVDSHKEFVRTLSPQDEKLYNFMKQKGKFIRQDIDEHLNVSNKTAGNRLEKFLKEGIITRHGGKGLKDTFYTFKA